MEEPVKPNVWEHEYILADKKKTYKVEFINYVPEDYIPDGLVDFNKLRDELDKGVGKFLAAYQINPLIPMRVEVTGKPYKVSMGEQDVIIVEKLDERLEIKGYDSKHE